MSENTTPQESFLDCSPMETPEAEEVLKRFDKESDCFAPIAAARAFKREVERLRARVAELESNEGVPACPECDGAMMLLRRHVRVDDMPPPNFRLMCTECGWWDDWHGTAVDAYRARAKAAREAKGDE